MSLSIVLKVAAAACAGAAFVMPEWAPVLAPLASFLAGYSLPAPGKKAA
jgi:hypothetical protein